MLTASLFCVIPTPSMKSSNRISPEWIRSFPAVVDKFDIVRSSFSPDGADAPLGVPPDAVLTSTVTDQPLQTISRRNPQIINIRGRVDQLELPQDHARDCAVDTRDVLLVPGPSSVLATEGPGHESTT